jgi:hypothetical protein
VLGARCTFRVNTLFGTLGGTTAEKIKMPEITDIMDVNIEDPFPEQRQQLQDGVDQFQQKCLLSFKKNRSGVPYLKNDMPRVLLPGRATPRPSRRERSACKHSGILQTTF